MIHHRALSSGDASSDRLRAVQLSTTRFSCLAKFPGFFGVLQMLTTQKSPQRHSTSS